MIAVCGLRMRPAACSVSLPNEWKAIWISSATRIGKPAVAPKRAPVPILTRWWTVGLFAQFVLEQHWDVLQEICHGAIQRFDTKEAALNQIASATWALMQTPEIKTNIKLVDIVYNSAFFSKHFKWLQCGNPEIGNKPGFLSRHLGVRYYLMMTEFDSWYDIDTNGKEGWK
jgi:hypothetical protein